MVTTTSREVRIGTQATLTCTISNVLPSGVTVQWRDGNTQIDEKVDISTVVNDEQMSTLTIMRAQLDSQYSCFISSNTFPDSAEASDIVIIGV